MAELDIEALKRLEEAWNPLDERRLYQMVPAIIAALEDRDRLRADWEDAMRQAIVLCDRNRPTMAGAILRAAFDRWPTAAALEGHDG